MTSEVEPDPTRADDDEFHHALRHAGFLGALLFTAVVDGLFLVASYYWQVWINNLMDPGKMSKEDAFFFHFTRLGLSTTPFVIVVVYTAVDMLGAVRRVWARR